MRRFIFPLSINEIFRYSDMKKSLLLIIAVLCVCNLNAQKNIAGLASEVACKMGMEIPDGTTAEQLLDFCNDAVKKFDIDKKETVPAVYTLRTVQNNSHDKFTDRVRIPDISRREQRKYYYLKNLKTGEYLHLNALGEPLVTVETPTDYSRFFFVKEGLSLGNSVSFISPYCNNNDVFYGPVSNEWSHETEGILADWNNPTFYFNALDDGRGFYISDKEKNSVLGDSGEVGEVWTYNPETGTIVITDEVDEYAVWVAEALYDVSPSLSSESDTIWYVIRNVGTGKYMHYEGPNANISTVNAPDTCSLFYGIYDGTGVKFGNYSAGNNFSCAGIGNWNATGEYFNILSSEEGEGFYISQSLNNEGNDIWMEGADGTIAVSSYAGNNSLWQFERIVNFKEIFGMGGNFGIEYIEDLFNDCLEILDSGKITPTQYYACVSGLLISALYGGGSYYEDINQIHVVEELISSLGDVVESSDKLLKEMSLFNLDYLAEDAENAAIMVKGLATNTTSLIVNDMTIVPSEEDTTVLKLAKKAEQRHTNMWQFYIKGMSVTQEDGSLSLNGDESQLYSILYNTATRMYISKPQYDEAKGEWVVSMTSDENKAGKYSVVNLDNIESNGEEFSELLEGYYGTLQLLSYDVKNCVLYLASPDDIALSCRVLGEEETADDIMGINWMYVSSTSVIDEKVYNHAQDAVNTYPGFIQDNFGLVQGADACDQFSSNFPLINQNSTYCKLSDNNFYSAFWTTDVNNANGDAHYLQVDLGEDKAVSSFSFFIKPNLNEYLNVPASITVSGSNDENGEFDVLAENIEMPNLLYDMSYISDKITTKNNVKYRYLRFTVNRVNAVAEGASEREFTLSEFYVYPDNEYVDKAKEDIDNFFNENYIDIEIIDPAVALMKQKAEYLLETNKDNHSETPGVGQYPTSKYNALKDACEALDHKNQESIDNLFNALEDFINSQVKLPLPTICILESAWEDGVSKGMAFSVAPEGFERTNIWDIRQWIKTGESGDEANPVKFELFALCGEEGASANVNFNPVDGWSDVYGYDKIAYNVYMNDAEAGVSVYLAVDKEADGLYLSNVFNPATIEENHNAAWYLVPLSFDAIDYVENEDFIVAMAEFGKVMAQAEYYENGYTGGQFVYVSGELTKTGFDDLYYMMKEYYDLGPVEVVKMYHAGEITDELVSVMAQYTADLQAHFPNFVYYNGYFRLRGRSSGNYMASDATGSFVMSAMYDENGVVNQKAELESIFYTQPTEQQTEVNVLSYEHGRYLQVADDAVKYDVVPELGMDYSRNAAFMSNGFAGFNDNYLVDNGTNVIASAQVGEEENCKWDVEYVNELPVVISSAKFATFYAPVELQIPEGVIAYVLYGESRSNGFDYNLSTGNIVEKDIYVFKVAPINGGVLPAGTPVILNAIKAGTYYFKINYLPTLADEEAKRATYSNGDEEITNLLEGYHEATYISKRTGYTHYVLANKSYGIGMYKVNTYESHTSKDGVVTPFVTLSFLNNAHRAWLPMPNRMSKSASWYVFSLGDLSNGTTGIEEVKGENGNVKGENGGVKTIYDLQGRRLTEIVSPGVYIVNGQCVFVK